MTLNIRDFSLGQLEFQMFVLDERADELLAHGKDVIKVTIGITDLPPPAKVLAEIRKRTEDLNETRRVFPEGIPELREAISRYYRRTYKVSADANHIIVNTGTSPIFRNLFQLCVQPGQEILVPRPYYCLYIICGLLAGAKIAYYDIDPKTKKIDFGSFTKAYDPNRTAMVVVNNVGNPVGNVHGAEEIGELYRIVNGRSYFLCDEIYHNTGFYSPIRSSLEFMPEYADTTIVTNGFSKGFRQYTKRVGFALLPEKLRQPMRVIQQHTLLTVDPVYQRAMIEALDDDVSVRELTDVYRARAEYSFAKLKNSGCTPIQADGGFYMVLDCDEWMKRRKFNNSQELALDILNRNHVATVPGSDFGYPRGLRLAFCSSRYNTAMDRLTEYFAG